MMGILLLRFTEPYWLQHPNVGAAHLKKWDTPPPIFGAVAFTFVNGALTLLTHVFIILRAFVLTFVSTHAYICKQVVNGC
jgi:hypothetical protein